MAIRAVALFGSRARGDQTPASDTDLLLVSEEDAPPLHTSMGSVSFSTYGVADLMAKADDGDLFLWHCLFEGKTVHDPENLFDDLRARFRLRSSYAREIDQAVALAGLLILFGEKVPNVALAAKRATWAVRTILISRSAERGAPRFAAQELLELAPTEETKRLLRLKDHHVYDAASARDLARFLDLSGLKNPLPRARTANDFIPLFVRTGNAIGLHFLEHTDDSQRPYA